jgi:hypothetical protein
MDSWKKATGIGPTATIAKGTGPARIGPVTPTDMSGVQRFERLTKNQDTREKLARFLPDQLVDMIVPPLKAEEFIEGTALTNDDVTNLGGMPGILKRSYMYRGHKPTVAARLPQIVHDVVEQRTKEHPRLAESIDTFFEDTVDKNAGYARTLINGDTTGGFAATPPQKIEVLGGRRMNQGYAIAYPKATSEIPTLDNRHIRTEIAVMPDKHHHPDQLVNTVDHELAHAAQTAFRGGNSKSHRENQLLMKYVPYPLRPEEIGARATANHRSTKELFRTDLENYGVGEPKRYKPPSYSESVREVLFGDANMPRDRMAEAVRMHPQGDVFKSKFRDNTLDMVTATNPYARRPGVVPYEEMMKDPAYRRYIELNQQLSKRHPFDVVEEIRRAGLQTAGDMIGRGKRMDRLYNGVLGSYLKRSDNALAKSGPDMLDQHARNAEDFIAKASDNKLLMERVKHALDKTMRRTHQRQEHPVIQQRDLKHLLRRRHLDEQRKQSR